MPPVISIGYERRNIEEFVDLLEEYGVQTLLDIRELPLSRKKGFSKRALAARLEQSGIQYSHLKIAGNPYRKQKDEIELCLRLYRNHLDDHPQVLNAVAEEFADAPTAILCYEREHCECHRSVLLDELQKQGAVSDVIRVE